MTQDNRLDGDRRQQSHDAEHPQRRYEDLKAESATAADRILAAAEELTRAFRAVDQVPT
jgi:predicted  nucleic acid-binding Zn-ribbon protein